jgi:hypothetical protein
LARHVITARSPFFAEIPVEKNDRFKRLTAIR